MNVRLQSGHSSNSNRDVLFASAIIFLSILPLAVLILISSKPQSYVDDITGYKISPPAGWKRDQTNGQNTENDAQGVLQTSWSAPTTADNSCGEDCPFASIFVQVYKTNDDSLGDAKDNFSGLSSGAGPGYSIESVAKTKLHGIPAYYVKYSFGCGGYPPNDCDGVVFVENYKGVVYFVSGYSNDISKYQNVINDALGSFMPGSSPDLSMLNSGI